MAHPSSAPAGRHEMSREERKVLAGTLVGTTIEWYDFFIYTQAAAFVLAPLYFAPLSEENAGLAQVVAWASLGISFLFRPLGAVVAVSASDSPVPSPPSGVPSVAPDGSMCPDVSMH